MPETKHIRVNPEIHQKAKMFATKNQISLQTMTEISLEYLMAQQRAGEQVINRKSTEEKSKS